MQRATVDLLENKTNTATQSTALYASQLNLGCLSWGAVGPH
jgi:hypothetical protein